MKFRQFFILLILFSITGCGIFPQWGEARRQREQQRNIAQATIQSAGNECNSKHLSGELKTYVETAKCVNSKKLWGFQVLNYPYMDLINLAAAKRLEVAEKLDKKEITETQASLEMTELSSSIIG